MSGEHEQGPRLLVHSFGEYWTGSINQSKSREPSVCHRRPGCERSGRSILDRPLAAAPFLGLVPACRSFEYGSVHRRPRTKRMNATK